MKFVILFLLSIGIVIVSGCSTKTSSVDVKPTENPSSNVFSKKYLALGDSYTIGHGVASKGRWPNQLTAQLRQKGFAIENPTIIAQTGWTTADLTEEIKNSSPNGPYDLVTLLIGVNDQYQGVSLETYRTRFKNILTQALTLAGNNAARVLVVSIPDWGQSPFAKGRDRKAIGKTIDRFNEVNRIETENAGARYVDITTISRINTNTPENFVSDGLHPSEKTYTSWVEKIMPEASAILNTSTQTEICAHLYSGRPDNVCWKLSILETEELISRIKNLPDSEWSKQIEPLGYHGLSITIPLKNTLVTTTFSPVTGSVFNEQLSYTIDDAFWIDSRSYDNEPNPHLHYKKDTNRTIEKWLITTAADTVPTEIYTIMKNAINEK